MAEHSWLGGQLRRLLHPVLGRWQLLVRIAKPGLYARAMRLRGGRGTTPMTAIAPFEDRIAFQQWPRVGRDGFLFHLDHDATDQMSGTILLAPGELAVWRDASARRVAWCRTHGAAFRQMIVPEKHVVYADRLPRALPSIAPRRPASQILAALDPEAAARTLYPVEALRRARAVRDTYLRTDTHWSSWGALVAYRTLVDDLARDVALDDIDVDALKWTSRFVVGDLGVRYPRERGETREGFDPPTPYACRLQNGVFDRGAVQVFESARTGLPTCVLFRDSFSSFLIPALMHGFSRVVAVSSLSCHYDLLERVRPDVVLVVAIERFLATFGRDGRIALPQDAGPVPFEQFTGVSLDAVAGA